MTSQHPPAADHDLGREVERGLRDPNSDVAKFNNHKPEPGVDALVSYLRKLPRDVPAGTRWNYSTGETNLVGILISQATKKPLAQYLQEKIWQPAGMEQQATWILSKTGQEISGCCIQAAARDFARFGQFILNGARVNGQASCPTAGWPRPPPTRTGSASPGAATATSGGRTPTAALPRAASLARASSSTPNASS
jgi:CubicO group peptidase (beta-lactamase class C family)